MIVHRCEQGSQDWHDLRCGIPTASQFDRLVTPKAWKPSASIDDYVAELVAEYMLGEPVEIESVWMARGRTIEREARAWYALEHGVTVEQVGFITDDLEEVGCSPDGLIGEDGGLEIKVPAAKNHAAYLINPAKFTAAYWHQCQGGLWITGRKWWDLVSYCPPRHSPKAIGMPPVVVRIEPNLDYHAILAECVAELRRKLDEVLVRFGYKKG